MESPILSSSLPYPPAPSDDRVSFHPYQDDPRDLAVTPAHLPIATDDMTPHALPATQAPDLDPPKDAKGPETRSHHDTNEADPPAAPRLRSSRLFKGKGKEPVFAQPERKQPLRLLDLPLDILKDIVKEVTHTNDLASLALCHSALHRLAIPHIYSRFDIVWPDSSTHTEPRSGVDALTYGLATLVMAEEIFGEAPSQRRPGQKNRFAVHGQAKASELGIRRRRGNHYAQFTKKFSLGNGPADWVQEYLITKEGGKMLGTLVALAVARMRALETFVWDMPTGILRDVWLALSSLSDRDDGIPCRLEKVAVRWHDNSAVDGVAPPVPTNVGLSVLSAQAIASHPAALDRLEHPSFSILPPLKSLSVLDIDELAYLDEMAVLIGRSIDKLKELRVGIARHAVDRDWVSVWEGSDAQQVDPEYPTAGSLTIGEKRLGGVLGVLTGFVNDMRRPKMTMPIRRKEASRSSARHSLAPEANIATNPPQRAAEASSLVFNDSQEPLIDLSPETVAQLPVSTPLNGIPALEGFLEPPVDPLISNGQASPLHDRSSPLFFPEPASPDETADSDSEPPEAFLDHKLKLDTLELERTPLCVPVLLNALDWTTLTSLTILHCPNHEQLWKTLRRTFAPTPKSPLYPSPRRSHPSPRKPQQSKPTTHPTPTNYTYSLNLRKLHTNAVTPSLLLFLKETLAPNTLQTLFLQETRPYATSVTVTAIHRGPLRRHRQSLTRLLLDSTAPSPASPAALPPPPSVTSSSRRWTLTRPLLASLTVPGRFPQLRELGCCLDYRDWHYFLQSLPSIPTLRSLYLPVLADHVHDESLWARELALQVLDVVALRPECGICYLGVGGKCFEILEGGERRGGDLGGLGGVADGVGDGDGGVGDGDDYDDDDDDDDDDDGDDDFDDELDDEDEVGEEEEDEDDEDDDDDEAFLSDDDDDGSVESLGSLEGGAAAAAAGGSRSKSCGNRLRLREILFYDDKVAVFKARHARL